MQVITVQFCKSTQTGKGEKYLIIHNLTFPVLSCQNQNHQLHFSSFVTHEQ